MKNRLFAAAAAFTLILAFLSSCSAPAPQVETQPAVTEETTNSAASYENQLKLLADSQSQWQQQDEPGEPYSYAVADLDQNGRLEILAMSTRGTGVFTFGKIYEVNDSASALAECSLPVEEGSLPEMILSSVSAASAGGTYYYLFTDDCKNGAAEYHQSIQAVSLKDGVISIETLGQSTMIAVDGNPGWTYSQNGQSITQEEYEAIIPAFQAEREGFTANFEWFTLENGMDGTILAKSWEAFQS